MNIDNYRLEQTCGACPEQYDVFRGEEQVGYLRLRHGVFRAWFPDAGGRCVMETFPIGDGIFDDSERDSILRQAIRAIHSALAERI